MTLITNLLLDTCVWLNVAQDPDAPAMLGSLKAHVDSGAVVLLVPTVVIDEFERNREKIIKQHDARLRTVIKHARSTASLLQGDDAKEMARLVDKAEKQIAIRGEEVAHSLNSTNHLLLHKKSIKIPPKEAYYTRVAQRALTNRAPFHRNKNSVADALHMECFYDWVRNNSDLERAVFVSNNTSDYCNERKNDQIHPDYAEYFIKENWSFSINVAEVIENLGPFDHSDEVKERYANAVPTRPGLCSKGGDHVFSDSGGAYLPSQYGGLTWHVFCAKCHARFDTGDSCD